MARTPTLADVRARRKTIANEVQALMTANPAIQKLLAEDKIMEATEQGLVSLQELLSAGPSVDQPTSGDKRSQPKRRGKKKRRNSAEALITAILRESTTTWWTAAEIKAALDLKTGKANKISTIRPALTAMVRKEGLLTRNGLKVALTERLQHREEPPIDL